MCVGLAFYYLFKTANLKLKLNKVDGGKMAEQTNN